MVIRTSLTLAGGLHLSPQDENLETSSLGKVKAGIQAKRTNSLVFDL